LVIEVMDNAGRGFLLVGQDRAAEKAGGFDAMVAGGGYVLDEGLWPRRCGGRGAAVAPTGGRAVGHQKTNSPPAFMIVESIEGVAGSHAGFAAGTGIQVHFESILLPGAGRAEGQKGPVMMCESGFDVGFLVPAGKERDRRKVTLLGQERVDQKA
jgi:hypothetical protein